MKRRASAILALLVVSSAFLAFAPAAQAAESSGNKFPIVLIHGFGGIGEEAVFGTKLFNGWGGFWSLPDYLRGLGYDVYVLHVGAFTSNWDRACEAFAQLKGGTVDYGAAHSAGFSHNQYGRTFNAFYPEWGEVGPDGTRNKVHVICHSMGGQTSRVLAQLLSDVRPEEGSSPLFAESHGDWIASITSLSSTHDGTSLAVALSGLIPFAEKLLGIMGVLLGGSPIYDPMMDQWGLTYTGGSVTEYLSQVSESAYWKSTKDQGLWDVSPQGASELNGWVEAVDDVYYFSYCTSKTTKMWFTDKHRPKITMTALMWPIAAIIGTYSMSGYGDPANWYENDGIVNTYSMSGPKLNSNDEIVPFNPNDIRPGRWNCMGKLDWDHAQVIGILSNRDEVQRFYRNHCAFLCTLPKGDPVPVAVADPVAEVIEEINNLPPPAGPVSTPFTDDSAYEGDVTPDEAVVDADGDGMADAWEEAFGIYDPASDLDNDDLTNAQEYAAQTNPVDSDTDDDGMTDGWEVANGVDRQRDDAAADYDGDTFTNADEFTGRTDPFNILSYPGPPMIGGGAMLLVGIVAATFGTFMVAWKRREIGLYIRGWMAGRIAAASRDPKAPKLAAKPKKASSTVDVWHRVVGDSPRPGKYLK